MITRLLVKNVKMIVDNTTELSFPFLNNLSGTVTDGAQNKYTCQVKSDLTQESFDLKPNSRGSDGGDRHEGSLGGVMKTTAEAGISMNDIPKFNENGDTQTQIL